MAGFTATEKILARASGRSGVRAGDDVEARPDFVLAYDLPGYTDVYERELRDELGVARVPAPERFAIFIDHYTPASNTGEAAFHEKTRRWCAEQGLALIEGRGIGHQVAAELGYGAPGAFVVHFDGHISQLGAFGALAIGLRRKLLEAFARERVAIRVPATTRLEVTGKLAPGVMARDLFHHVVGRFGNRFCNFQTLEIGGPALEGLSDEAFQTITGLAMFTGALTAMIDLQPGPRLDRALAKARAPFEPAWSDPDAIYSARLSLDLSEVVPIVVAPPSPANTRWLADHIGLALDVGYIGSCASGRIEDLRAAAQVLEGRRIAPGFKLFIVPTSHAIMAQASREGLLATLLEAGAFVAGPTCDYCFGHQGAMAAGQRALTTGTLNVRGRMGSPDSEIWLASAASVAASALEGRLADPRRYFA